ncbi:hypothetical protein D9611_010793 [Ephemerocybe angulata]|uniref:Uncharacterized protein n=1 Tax=Ephemerocybe angulata TaxID=980116 RepID=A0A8H5F220_9AGAR|nr:hypothetical protein D9611_010793 [Tulosesus angulatus]
MFHTIPRRVEVDMAPVAEMSVANTGMHAPSGTTQGRAVEAPTSASALARARLQDVLDLDTRINNALIMLGYQVVPTGDEAEERYLCLVAAKERISIVLPQLEDLTKEDTMADDGTDSDVALRDMTKTLDAILDEDTVSFFRFLESSGTVGSSIFRFPARSSSGLTSMHVDEASVLMQLASPNPVTIRAPRSVGGGGAVIPLSSTTRVDDDMAFERMLVSDGDDVDSLYVQHASSPGVMDQESGDEVAALTECFEAKARMSMDEMD